MRATDAVILGSALVSTGFYLQGCDSGSASGNGTSVEDTTVPTTPGPQVTTGGPSTTFTTNAPPKDAPPRSEKFTEPMSSSDAARAFSEAFHGYDQSSSASMLGVTITWLKESDTKMNLYCGLVAGNDEDGCFDASASCRMSAILHNHHLPLVDGKVLTFSGRKVGVVFNQELVEQYFGKCSYMFDGGTVNRYNFGCGDIGAEEFLNCESKNSPYMNICPSTGKTCTADDVEVNAVQHKTEKDPMSFYTGPAYNVTTEELTHWNGKQMWATKDQLRTMINDRYEVQQTVASEVHNELILDERLMLTQLWWDPATVVSGFIYFRGDSESRSQAVTIQKSFKEDWGMEPPLVSVDADCKAASSECAPFYADTGTLEVVV